jgi:5-formyltetrahydrofolate cyclo-ligase
MKSMLRKRLRAARFRMSPSEHQCRSRLAARNVAALPGFACGKRVALYLPFDRETDTAVLLREARRRGVRVFVPVVLDRRRGRMQFRPLSGKLKRGHFGIQIPHRTLEAVSARWLDLIVLPLVGADAQGHRLGMGAGFYDRVLAFRRLRTHPWGPRLVGLAFDAQRTREQFAEAWDIRLDALATESGLHHFSKR